MNIAPTIFDGPRGHLTIYSIDRVTFEYLNFLPRHKLTKQNDPRLRSFWILIRTPEFEDFSRVVSEVIKINVKFCIDRLTAWLLKITKRPEVFDTE